MMIITGHEASKPAVAGDATDARQISLEEKCEILKRCLIKGESAARTVAKPSYFKRGGKVRR